MCGYDTIEFSPEQCYSFLRGIVSDDLLVEFEVESSEIKESEGTYSNPIDQDDLIDIVEYCADDYDRDRFVPLRYAVQKDVFSNKFDWYNFN